MNLVCPFCSARFRAAIQEPLQTPVRLSCPACQRQMVLRPNVDARTPRRPDARTRGRAAIVDSPRPFRDFLQKELKKLKFDAQSFDAGDAALAWVRENKADLVVLNVALKKGKMGMELAEEIRKDPELPNTRVVLIGPLFRANKFRNDPGTIYGADDYFEEQIPARELESRVETLLGNPRVEGKRTQDDEAQMLARLILSDIVISHPDQVREGLRSDTFFDVLKKEIDEGRAYYETHVPYRIRQGSEYFTEIFQDFVQLKREEL